MRMIARSVMVSAVLAVAFLYGANVNAQEYPTKTVRIIVPYAPGGAGDVMARVIGHKMSDSWGQQVIVDNRPGAAGMIGAAIVAKSLPDGHTILLGYTSEIAVSPNLYSKMTYDPLRELSAVAMAGVLPLLLVANPSLPVRSVKDMLALAKARPGQITYGSAGNGTPAHLGMELLKTIAKVDMTHVPYKGGAEVVTAILGGHVMLFFSGIPPAIPHVTAGKLRALAVSTKSRAPSLPEIPTVAESGVPGFDLSGWFGYFVPAGTPRQVIDKINEAVNSAIKNPDVAKQFDRQGVVVSVMSPPELAAFVDRETKKYAQVIKQSGAKAD